jgi:hypothetical protein
VQFSRLALDNKKVELKSFRRPTPKFLIEKMETKNWKPSVQEAANFYVLHIHTWNNWLPVPYNAKSFWGPPKFSAMSCHWRLPWNISRSRIHCCRSPNAFLTSKYRGSWLGLEPLHCSTTLAIFTGFSPRKKFVVFIFSFPAMCQPGESWCHRRTCRCSRRCGNKVPAVVLTVGMEINT